MRASRLFDSTKGFLPVAIFLCLLVSACGEKSEPAVTEEIPDNVTMIKRLNIPQLMKSAGCAEPFNSAGELTEDASRLIDLTILPDFRATFVDLLKSYGLKTENTIAFTTSRGEDVMVIPVEDASLVFNGFPADSVKVEDGGYEYAEKNDMTVILTAGKCWIARSLEVVKNVRREASESHIGYLPGVRQFIENDHSATLAVKCGHSPLSFLGDDNKWVCVEFDASDAAVSASAVVIDRDGRPDSIGGDFQEIDSDFLRYVPGDASIVLAFGEFSGNARGLQFLFGRYAPLYMDETNGTTSLYARPAASAEAIAQNKPGAWNIQTMTHLSEENLAEGILQYREASGNNAIQRDGQWSYTLGQDTYYFGAFDSYLMFATNKAISSDYNNSFTEDFLGKRAAITVNIPADGVLKKGWDLPSGVVFKMAVDAMVVKARISFPGSTATPLATLLHMPQLPDLRARFGAMICE